MAHMQQMLAASVTGVITLEGESATSGVNDPEDASASLRYNQDGTIDRIVNETVTQVGSWISPESLAPGAYQIRYTALTGDPLTSGPAAEDSWFAFSTGNAVFTMSRTTLGSSSANYTVEIRLGTGPALDSATDTLTASVL